MLRSPWSPPAVMLVLLMAVGSVVMWIGVPLGLIYVASQLAELLATRPPARTCSCSVGLPIGMAIVGKCLGRPRSRCTRASPAASTTRRPRDLDALDARRARRPRAARGVLDRVMVTSVGLAILAFAIWFFGFAGSSLPK